MKDENESEFKKLLSESNIDLDKVLSEKKMEIYLMKKSI